MNPERPTDDGPYPHIITETPLPTGEPSFVIQPILTPEVMKSAFPFRWRLILFKVRVRSFILRRKRSTSKIEPAGNFPPIDLYQLGYLGTQKREHSTGGAICTRCCCEFRWPELHEGCGGYFHVEEIEEYETEDGWEWGHTLKCDKCEVVE